MTTLTCASCGITADPAADALELIRWSTSVEAGRTTSTCPACARVHIRDIEAKLDLAR